MTEEAMRRELRGHVDRAGSMRALAREWQISAAYVSDCLNGRLAPGPSILGPMGFKRVVRVSYEREDQP